MSPFRAHPPGATRARPMLGGGGGSPPPPPPRGGGGGAARHSARARGTCGRTPATVDPRGGAACSGNGLGSTPVGAPQRGWVHHRAPRGVVRRRCARRGMWHGAAAPDPRLRRPMCPTRASGLHTWEWKGREGVAVALQRSIPPRHKQRVPLDHHARFTRAPSFRRGGGGCACAAPRRAQDPTPPLPPRRWCVRFIGGTLHGFKRVHNDALGQGGASSEQSRQHKVHPTPSRCAPHIHTPTRTVSEHCVGGDSAVSPPGLRG